MKAFTSLCILVLFVSFISAGCTGSELDQVRIPEYPGAREDQEHTAEILGMEFGSVRRVITGDSFDKVFAFYSKELRSYDPKIITHTLDDGRQAAITIMESRKGSRTVAIQEFKEEGLVAITFMSAGS